MARLAVGSDTGASAGFGHRPGFNQGKAKTHFEGGVMLGVNIGTKAETNLMAALFAAHIEAEQDGRHDAEIMHDCGFAGGHVPPPGGWMKSVELNETTTAEEHGHERAGHGIHMIKRQRRDKTLAAVLDGAETALRNIPAAHAKEIIIAEQAAFGLAASTRGVKYCAQTVASRHIGAGRRADRTRYIFRARNGAFRQRAQFFQAFL